jgi:hypothetical protein
MADGNQNERSRTSWNNNNNSNNKRPTLETKRYSVKRWKPPTALL